MTFSFYHYICRNKCAACFRQFNKLEHLVEHMRISYHSVHEPTCGICRKHCRSFESLREHLIGTLSSWIVKQITRRTLLNLIIDCEYMWWEIMRLINLLNFPGPLPKQECRDIFAYRGCKFCLRILDSPHSRRIHQEKCQLSSGVNTLPTSEFKN